MQHILTFGVPMSDESVLVVSHVYLSEDDVGLVVHGGECGVEVADSAGSVRELIIRGMPSPIDSGKDRKMTGDGSRYICCDVDTVELTAAMVSYGGARFGLYDFGNVAVIVWFIHHPSDEELSNSLLAIREQRELYHLLDASQLGPGCHVQSLHGQQFSSN